MNNAKAAELHPVRGMLRQGDVLLVPVELAVGLTSNVSVDEEIVLALGERTGHAHVVRGRARSASTATAHYLLVDGPATLFHEEHDPIALAPGAYEVRRQREWTPEPSWSSARDGRWVND
jgi:hypothetical protein